MKKDQKISVVRIDILDIIKALKLLNILQKEDIIIKIIDTKATPSD
jgi:hypothetical protein